MPKKLKFISSAFAAIHASATALWKIAAINQTVMNQFDAACLATPAALERQRVGLKRLCHKA